mmetsp:Transcript_47039/g.114783  ORF Transcript_47039/g.114783 Transcript_47039/m.114783 type:complete len:588 (+) Transcript_47039:411-2174(+)
MKYSIDNQQTPTTRRSSNSRKNATANLLAVSVAAAMSPATVAFVHHQQPVSTTRQQQQQQQQQQSSLNLWSVFGGEQETSRTAAGASVVANENDLPKRLSSMVAGAALVAALTFGGFPGASFAENELSDKYGGKGFDSSLVDQTCLVDKCSVQAKACLADDPSCRKGLTCTAKCMGDNSCITGCMARYGNTNLDSLLKCTVEDNQCIKIAILDGGADPYGQEPRAPKATVANFDYHSLQGSWYKVVGYNPNYDCYACQRNTFSLPSSETNEGSDSDVKLVSSSSSGASSSNTLNVGVEFSMPHMLPDGTPPPPRQVRESMAVYKEDIGTNNGAGSLKGGFRSIGLNEYNTNEVMVFDAVPDSKTSLVMNKGKNNEATYSRTAHSEGEMFGLKFWENWYVIGENEPGQAEFKFIYYNGKTRQNTYDGAFVYSRSRSLEPESMTKVYSIAKEAGMNPDQFCKIRNGCFENEGPGKLAFPSGENSKSNPGYEILNDEERVLRGILASTKVSELLGVESVSAEIDVSKMETSEELTPIMTSKMDGSASASSRPWWFEVGDYLENPRRHFEVMDTLRKPMEWPESVKSSYKQ